MQESTLSEVKEASVEQLPIYVLRDKLAQKGIAFKSTDKKPALIKALLTGESVKKKVEKKAAARITDKVSVVSLPIVSDDLKKQLAQFPNLTYDVDENDGCINFYGQLTTSANLDQPISSILIAAREAAKAQAMPPETNSLKDM